MRFLFLSLTAIAAVPLVSAARAASCERWAQVESPNISVKGDNTFAAVDGRTPDDVWAVGQYAPDSNVNITLTFVAHYDGRAWSYVPSPNVGKQANAFHSLAVTPTGQVWAVGYYIDDRTFYSRALIEFWDGAQWQVIKHPDDPGASAVLFGVSAASTHNIWAVGEYQHPLDRFHTLIEHFDGTRWSIVPSPDPGTTGNVLYGVKALDRNAAWAVGEENGNGPLDRALILGWGGEKWTAFDAPSDPGTNTRLLSLAADSAGVIYAVGEAENDFKRTAALSEMAMAGRRWSIERTPQVGKSDNHFYGVAADAGGTRWAVGAWFDPKSGRQFTLAERSRAGEAWQVLDSPSPSKSGDSLLATAVAVGHDVWAVGAYDGPKAQKSLILHTCR
jgi:hypothetical protein